MRLREACTFLCICASCDDAKIWRREQNNFEVPPNCNSGSMNLLITCSPPPAGPCQSARHAGPCHMAAQPILCCLSHAEYDFFIPCQPLCPNPKKGSYSPHMLKLLPVISRTIETSDPCAAIPHSMRHPKTLYSAVTRPTLNASA